MKVRRIKNLSESDFKKKPAPRPKTKVATVDEAIGVIKDEPQKEPAKAPEVTETIEEIFEGVKEEPVQEPEQVRNTEMLKVAEEDMGHFDIASAEAEYKAEEMSKEAAPIIQTTVNSEVKKAVKLNNERLKLEVNEVLADEVGYRLDRYEKRRKYRQRKELVTGVLKAMAVVMVVLFIFGNTQLRLRFQIIIKDIGDLVNGLVNNEEVTSNQLVEDMFRNLGDELNDINTVDVKE